MNKFFLALVLLAPMAQADWQLDNEQSRLSFVSTKAGAVAEVHYFEQLEGGVDEQGELALSIQLASVQTAIDIRNQRMRELLFQTERFPSATLTATLDSAALDALPPGSQSTMQLEALLRIRDQQLPLAVEVTVARLDAQTLLVQSRQPLVVYASQLGLSDGVEALREVAGLPSISPAVPVSFNLTFREGG